MKDYEPEFKDLRKIIILDRVHFYKSYSENPSAFKISSNAQN